MSDMDGLAKGESATAAAQSVAAVVSRTETSEGERGIAEQPGPTCPLIDKAIMSVRKSLGEMEGWQKHREEPETLCNMLDYAEWRLGSVEDELEDVRRHVEEVRAWGQEWKEYARRIEAEKCG